MQACADAEPLDPERVEAGEVHRTAEEREELQALLADVGALSDHQRAALLLRELAGLGYDEVAAVLETTPLAARQAVFAARASLHEQRAGRELPWDHRARPRNTRGQTPRVAAKFAAAPDPPTHEARTGRVRGPCADGHDTPSTSPAQQQHEISAPPTQGARHLEEPVAVAAASAPAPPAPQPTPASPSSAPEHRPRQQAPQA
jgi:hypothetical protein